MTLDEDIARAVAVLRREHGLGLSAALNALARRGLGVAGPGAAAFEQRTSAMGVPRIPLDDIGAALDLLDGESRRG